MFSPTPTLQTNPTASWEAASKKTSLSLSLIVLALALGAGNGCESSLPPEDPPSSKKKASEEPQKGRSRASNQLTITELGRQPRVKLRYKSKPGEQHLYRVRVKLTHKRGGGESRARLVAVAMLENKGETRGGHLLELSFPHLDSYSPTVGRSEMIGLLTGWRRAFVLDPRGGIVRAVQGVQPTAPSESSRDLPAKSKALPLIGSATARWPKKAVGQGARWSFLSRQRLDVGGEAAKKRTLLVVDTSYHLESLKKVRQKTTAKIVTSTTLRLEKKGEGTLGRGTGEATILFEVDTGTVQKVVSQVELEISPNPSTPTISHEQKLVLKRVRRRAVERFLENE